MENELSQAVVSFLGFGSAASPRLDRSQLLQEFGTSRGIELEKEVRSILEEMNTINIDWSVHSLQSAGEMARSYMHNCHPNLSDAALDALVWKFTFDWR